MKRAFLRKVKSVSCSSCESHAPVGESEQTMSGVRRKARTSAAMVGLALSMGATSLLVPRQNDGAAAAESKTPEVSPSSVSRVATLPSEADIDFSTASFSDDTGSEVITHTVRNGQTLQQIANRYSVRLEALAALNNLASTASLQAGQVLRIPSEADKADKVGIARSPQILALADLSRLPAPTEVNGQSSEQIQEGRTQALNRLRQERNKLKQNLAELRREEVESSTVQGIDAERTETGAQKVVNATPVNELSQAEAVAELPRSAVVDAFPSIATLPSPTATSAMPSVVASTGSELDWMRANQSLVLPMGEPELAPQPSEQVNIPTANSLSGSGQVAARPEALMPSPMPLNAAPVMDVTPRETSYQVSPGDTIARIARAHNIPQSSLIAANRLSDPNVIFVGQVLRLPGQATVETPSVPSVVPIVAANPNAESVGNLSLPTVPTRVDASQADSPEPVAVLPANVLLSPESSPTQLAPANVDPQPAIPNAVGGRNPYVQNLLSEVRSMRERRLQQAGVEQTPVTVAATPVEAESLSSEALRNETVTLPRSVNRSRPVDERGQTPSGLATPTVVAAAPLGSERYEPLLEPITGRMVSPDLPALPDADRFLPNGTLKGYTWPARGVLSSGYGWRWGRMHHGIDIAADIGTPIYSAASGVVEYAGWNSGGYGNMVEVRHSDGSMTRYAHLNAIYVRVGQRVSQSEQIAEMGSTGYSTGPHLHFEVHLADQGTVNPISYLPAE